MEDSLISFLSGVTASTAFYPVLAVIVWLDCLLPLIPSETLLNAAGAWAGAAGVPNLWATFGCAVLAAVLGDNLCFLCGARLYPLMERMARRPRLGRAVEWLTASLREHDALCIISARFIPWARWAATILLASRHYPWRRFILFDSLGVLVWAAQSILIGYAGGHAFAARPLVGLAVGIALGMAAGVLVQWVARACSARDGAFRA